MTAEESIRLYEWEKRMMLEDAREEGLNQGISEGIELNIKQTIKSLLNKKMSIDDISDVTGKTIEEIKNIANNE